MSDEVTEDEIVAEQSASNHIVVDPVTSDQIVPGATVPDKFVSYQLVLDIKLCQISMYQMSDSVTSMALFETSGPATGSPHARQHGQRNDE